MESTWPEPIGLSCSPIIPTTRMLASTDDIKQTSYAKRAKEHISLIDKLRTDGLVHILTNNLKAHNSLCDPEYREI